MNNSEFKYFSALSSVKDLNTLWSIVDDFVNNRRKSFKAENVEYLISKANNIVLYGAGDFSREVLSCWKKKSIEFPIKYFVDNSPLKQGGNWLGYPVCDMNALTSDISKPLVIITAMNTQCIAMKLDEIALPYIFAERDGSLDFIPGHILTRRRGDCDKVYELLADDWSRYVFLSVIIARIFQDLQFPMKGNLFTDRCTTLPQYFPLDLPPITNGERYVDCGTYDGDSLASFVLEASRIGLSNYCAIGIEADSNNLNKTRDNLKALGLYNVLVKKAVLGTGKERVKDMHLSNCDGGVIQSEGDTLSLDSILIDYKPSYIKMDIEGAELSALVGGVNIINQENPRLAICNYHSTSDLINIPLFIANNFSNYNIYMRHHRSGSLWETVCYAYPNYK